MLGREGEPDDEAAEQGPLPAHRFDEAIEGVDRSKEAARSAHVGGDEGRVGEHGWIEDKERHRDQTGSGAEHLSSGKKEQQGQRERKDQDGHVDAEEQRVRAVMSAVLWIVAEEQLAAAIVGLGLEESALPGSDFEIEWQKRQGCHELDQRRMLRVEAVLAVLPVHVAGIDVIALIPTGRFLPCGQADLGHHDQQQKADRCPDTEFSLQAPSPELR